MHNFKELKIWQKSVELAKEVYKITSAYRSKEQFGLNYQMCRDTLALPLIISEGCGSKTDTDFSNFFSHAQTSQFEPATQWIISKEIDLLGQLESDRLISDTNEI